MKKKSIMKVSRGRLEDDKQKSEDSYEYLRVLRIMIPLIMGVKTRIYGIFITSEVSTLKIIETIGIEQISSIIRYA